MVVKVKKGGRFGTTLSMGLIGDSWPKAECTYDAETRKFTCTYNSGEQQLEDCWLVDVKDRPNKKQHRFDIANDNAREATVELAATSGEVKRKWVATMETKEQRTSREEAEETARALCVLHALVSSDSVCIMASLPADTLLLIHCC
jgi:hypothetical protein